MFVVHIEKAIDKYRGIYAAINQMCAQKVFFLCKYINREEDMGLPGLRRSKMAYCPAWLEYKYMLKVSVE